MLPLASVGANGELARRPQHVTCRARCECRVPPPVPSSWIHMYNMYYVVHVTMDMDIDMDMDMEVRLGAL